MTVYLLALLAGIITGLRTFSGPTAVSIAAMLGRLNVSGTPLAFLGYMWTPWIMIVLAALELVGDQLPSTPSRTVPMQFSARIIAGALSGAAIGAASNALAAGLVVGIIGAVIGTLGGHAARISLAKGFGRDRPAALIEDAVAYVGAAIIVSALP